MIRTEEREAVKSGPDKVLPDLNPWREVGWIFRDGRCVAIERRGAETRARVLAE